MPDRELLESYPLYRKKPGTVDEGGGFEGPAIKMECPVCQSEQTFNQTNHVWRESDEPAAGPLTKHTIGAVLRFVYKCASCKDFYRYFLIYHDEEALTLTKVGQWPSPDISLDPLLRKALGAHADLLKKGLVCESQGYGIGAYGYFRRIVEEVIDDLLLQVEQLIPEAERGQFHSAVEQTKSTRVAQEKIALVKDLLPSSLRPGGANPLSALHEALSEGLHSGSDERCLELAGAIREVLVHMTSQIASQAQAHRAFTDGMRKILLDKGKLKGGTA